MATDLTALETSYDAMVAKGIKGGASGDAAFATDFLMRQIEFKVALDMAQSLRKIANGEATLKVRTVL